MTLRKIRPTAAGLPARPGPAFDSFRRPERLVGVGFRCWLAGYETNDIDCWETGWNLYARELGARHAKAAVGELTCWVRAVHAKACRRISTYPFGCRGFCRDEYMAISMVAASQHSACPAMRACAFALLGSSDIEGVVESAAGLAGVLRDTGHMLSDRSICDASMISALETPPHMLAKH